MGRVFNRDDDIIIVNKIVSLENQSWVILSTMEKLLAEILFSNRFGHLSTVPSTIPTMMSQLNDKVWFNWNVTVLM